MSKQDFKFPTRAVITLLVAMLCSIGVWAQQALPYSYGFENGNVTTDGWIANFSNSSSGIKSGGPEHSGSYGFAFYYSEQSGSLISPLFTDGDNGIEVSFWYKEYSDYYGDEQFQVGYTTDETVTNASEFIYGDVITASTDWQQYSNTFPAGTKRIAIKYIYNDCYFLFLDDFVFEAISNCTKPAGLTISDITPDEALVTWTSESDLFNLRYKASNETEWTTINGIDKGTSYPLDNLTPATSYEVQVQAVCSSTEQSGWVSTSFTTDCQESYAIPYAYGFEDARDMYCWTQIDTELTNGYYNTSENAYAHTGDGCYYFSSYNGTTTPQYFISPQLSGIVNGLHVEFWYRKGPNGEESFKVGYSTSDNDLASFIWGDEITNLTATYQQFKANYPAETKYIAVQYTGSDSYYVFLDDFTFEEAASVLEPSGVHASELTTTSAAISWTPGASETVWDIYITDNATDVPDENTTPTVANTSDNPYSVTGLTPATYYYAYVRAIVGAETSAWSTPLKFNTKAEPMALPYSYGFDDAELPIGWTNISTNPAYCTINVLDPTGSSGNNVLAYYMGASNGTLITVLPEVDAAYPLNKYQISFDACIANSNTSAITDGKIGIGIMTDPEDVETFELIEEVDITDEFNNYGSFTVMLNSYNGTGRYIAIKDIYTQNGYVLVDNVSVTELPSVIQPTNPGVSTITSHSAELSWTANNGETEWTVYYKKATDSDYTAVDVTENPYTLTGLNAFTSYSFYVVAKIGEESSAPSEVVNFTTIAEPVTSFPWTEDFNELTVANSIPEGWNNDDGTVPSSSPAYKWCYNTNTSGNGATNGTSYDSSNCVRFNSYNSSNGLTNFLKTVPLSLPTDPEMQLTFWYKNPAGGDFSVFISTDGGATYETALATGLTGVSTWTKINPIYLSAYAGQEVVIVFKGTSNYGNGNAYIYLDDVTVEEVPACAAPTGLSVANITTNSAELSWTANSGETEWTIYYKKASETDYTEVPNVTENPYTLTGLDSSSDYVFYVVAHKGTDTSGPSSTCNFSTDCDIIVVDAANSFFEGFEGTTFVPNCWTNVTTVSNGNTRQWTRKTTQHHSGSASASSGWYGDIYLKLPALQIDGDAVLSFWSYNSYISDYNKNSVVLIDGSDEIELWSPTEVTSSWVNTVIDLSAYNGETISLAFKYEGVNAHEWYVDDVELYVPADITLLDDADNTTIISNNNNKIAAHATIQGRTLYKDGSWNTLYLPFDVDDIATSPLAGATIKALDVESTVNGHKTGVEDNILFMNFADADAIQAGIPYIIKWENGDNITDPVFENVTITDTYNLAGIQSIDNNVAFVGVYSPTDLIAGLSAGGATVTNDNILFLGANNALYHPSDAGSTLNAFRAFFYLPNNTSATTKFVLNFGDEGETTGIVDVKSDKANVNNGAWYNLSGQRVNNARPTQKGVYIVNGKKVVIK